MTEFFTYRITVVHSSNALDLLAALRSTLSDTIATYIASTSFKALGPNSATDIASPFHSLSVYMHHSSNYITYKNPRTTSPSTSYINATPITPPTAPSPPPQDSSPSPPQQPPPQLDAYSSSHTTESCSRSGTPSSPRKWPDTPGTGRRC